VRAIVWAITRFRDRIEPPIGKPRVHVIVWRDDKGRLRFHGPPRWYEIEGIEEPRLVRAHDVTERLEQIVAALRGTDETPTLAELSRCE
jgi:hypothetical protein